jgi:hypothetical protein
MTDLVPFAEMSKMAAVAANSRMFGFKTQDEALAIMLLCQGEGLHPAVALRDYHVISGRPSMKSDAMLARFQQAGGSVKWSRYDETGVSGVFSHPAGGSVEITWTIEQAKAANLSGKDVWKAYPRAMLRARCISEGIRTVFPACIVGTYTPEEIDAMPPEPRHVENLAAAVAPAPAPAASPANEALPLIDPNAKEHAFASVEIWHKAAMRAIGMLAHDPAALRAWADANAGTFGAVAERYPDTVKEIRTAISARLFDHEEPTEQEPAE